MSESPNSVKFKEQVKKMTTYSYWVEHIIKVENSKQLN